MPTEYCRHIRTNGRRCCSPALRGKAFCYYHVRVNQRHRALNPAGIALPDTIPEQHRSLELLQRDPLMAQYYGLREQLHGPIHFDFPALEDRESIQVALSMIITAMGHNRVDPKLATSMLYGLQVASANARTLAPSLHDESHVVRDTALDEAGNELAPDEDPQEIIDREELLASLHNRNDPEDEDFNEVDDDEENDDFDDGN